MPFLNRFGGKNQNDQFKLKFVTKTNSKHAGFNGDVHFYRLWPKIIFLGKFSPKIQNYLLKVKFDTQTNSYMQNSMVTFTFSVFDGNIVYRNTLLGN